jgi:hypothetical protein
VAVDKIRRETFMNMVPQLWEIFDQLSSDIVQERSCGFAGVSTIGRAENFLPALQSAWCRHVLCPLALCWERHVFTYSSRRQNSLINHIE